MRVKIMNMIL